MGFFFNFYIITRFSRYYGIYNFFALFVSLFKIPLKQFNTDSYLWRLSLTRDLSLDGLIPHACHHGPNAIFFLNWFFFSSSSFVSYPILLANNMHTIFDYNIYITCFTFSDNTSFYLYMYQEHRIPSIEQLELYWQTWHLTCTRTLFVFFFLTLYLSLTLKNNRILRVLSPEACLSEMSKKIVPFAFLMYILPLIAMVL